jgi:hypothetical protein
MEAWFKTGMNGSQEIFHQGYDGNHEIRIEVAGTPAKLYFSTYEAGYGLVAGTTTVSTNTWFYGAIKRDASIGYVRLNSAQENSGAIKNVTALDRNTIGAYRDTYGGGRTGYYFNGTIDEVRISNIARSDGWLKATYETTRDHLLDWGAEEGGPQITNSQSTWALGYVQVNDVRYFSAGGAQDDDYATVTNTGTCSVNVAIQGLDMEGGAYDWTLASAAGNQTYSLYANSGNGSSTYNTEVKKSSYSNLVAALVVNGTYLWSMKFTTPTIYNPSDDGAQKTTTVTLVATAS